MTREQRIDNKIARDRYKIDYLLDRKVQEEKWIWMNPSVENYRRMMVPFYLLEEECNPFPVYVDNSTINTSLTLSHYLKNIKIILSHTVFDVLQHQHQLQVERKKKLALSKQKTNIRDSNTEVSRISEHALHVLKEKEKKMINPKIGKEIMLGDFSLLATADSLI